MKVNDATVSFFYRGDWALLHMLESQRAGFSTRADGKDSNRVSLEFIIPTVSLDSGTASEARMPLGFKLSGKDPDTYRPIPVVLLRDFPRSAPVEW